MRRLTVTVDFVVAFTLIFFFANRSDAELVPYSATWRTLQTECSRGRLFGRSLWSAWQPAAEYLGGGVESELLQDLALARC